MLKALNSIIRAVAMSENLGGTQYWVGIMCPPLVEIGLTDLPKTGGGGRTPPPAPTFEILSSLAVG